MSVFTSEPVLNSASGFGTAWYASSQGIAGTVTFSAKKKEKSARQKRRRFRRKDA